MKLFPKIILFFALGLVIPLNSMDGPEKEKEQNYTQRETDPEKNYGEKEATEDTALREAAEQGNIEAGERAIKDGANFLARNSQGQSLDQIAAANGHQPFADWIKKIIDDWKTIQDKLIQAIQQQDLEGASRAIQEGAHVVPDYERLPLLEAAKYDVSGDIVELLLDLGSPVNAIDNRGKGALHRAARCGYLPTVLTLLMYGAGINEEDYDDITPLDEALNLLIHVTGINNEEDYDETPRDEALNQILREEGPLPAYIYQLLALGARPHQRRSATYLAAKLSPLMWAVLINKTQKATALLKKLHNALLTGKLTEDNMHDITGAFLIACSQGNKNLIHTFIHYFKDVFTLFTWKRALYTAALNNQTDTVRVLCQFINLDTPEGRRILNHALLFACGQRHAATVQAIVERDLQASATAHREFGRSYLDLDELISHLTILMYNGTLTEESVKSYKTIYNFLLSYDQTRMRRDLFELAAQQQSIAQPSPFNLPPELRVHIMQHAFSGIAPQNT